MTALGEARTAVHAALASVGVPVYAQPPQTVTAPCVVLVPGALWITRRGQVTIDVLAAAVPAGGNASALDRLEHLVEAVRDGLWTHQLAADDTQPPTSDTNADTSSCRTPVTLRTTCH